MTIPRKTPLPRKRATKRAWKSPRCTVRGCKQIARVFVANEVDITGNDRQIYGRPAAVDVLHPHALCTKHARHEADRLWSLRVRKGYCELAAWHQGLGIECGGPIVACHGFGRSYGGTRWMPLNGFSGCSGINNWTESHPLEWDAYLRSVWGETVYEELRQRAVGPYKVDFAAVLASLGGAPSEPQRRTP